MLVSGYFRLPHDIPKPFWRYPMSYISFHYWALQVKISTFFTAHKLKQPVNSNQGLKQQIRKI